MRFSWRKSLVTSHIDMFDGGTGEKHLMLCMFVCYLTIFTGFPYLEEMSKSHTVCHCWQLENAPMCPSFLLLTYPSGINTFSRLLNSFVSFNSFWVVSLFKSLITSQLNALLLVWYQIMWWRHWQLWWQVQTVCSLGQHDLLKLYF